ncbi:unnamed protein product [Dovyalis caffra]|uniref:Uncharacterized protein n=1 Tax=Dovyalis caffra TaxID=77055 RepID=A0AAV1R6F4_9ROSI|nr:unnamed protein product [Dovyalis caffra]
MVGIRMYCRGGHRPNTRKIDRTSFHHKPGEVRFLNLEQHKFQEKNMELQGLHLGPDESPSKVKGRHIK